MPRRPRFYMPGLSYHIVQRGNNRQACFFESEDCQRYLQLWQESSNRYGVAVHAYVLMTNHIHFLATPAFEDSISNVTKVVGSRYAQYVNRRYRRTGSLWEGRHKSSAVQAAENLLKCYRYIELNPVAAGMVKRPEQYRWSSYEANAWGEVSWLSPHPLYIELGATADERGYVYRELFKTKLSDEDLHSIRQATHYCHPLGDERFKKQIEKKTGVKLGQAARGRPKRKRS